jgi:hypothetical protein
VELCDDSVAVVPESDVIFLRSVAFASVRESLEALLQGDCPAGFSLQSWLLGRGAVRLDTGVELSQLRSQRTVESLPQSSAHEAVAVINLDTDPARWATSYGKYWRIGPDLPIVRVRAVENRENPSAGFAVSWRKSLVRARDEKWESVLISADDVDLLREAPEILVAAQSELKDMDWDVLYLGHDSKSRSGQLVPGATVLRACVDNSGAHAVIVHTRAYKKLLDAVPESASAEFNGWTSRFASIGDFLRDGCASGLINGIELAPGIATNRNLIRSGAVESAYSRHYVV